eukprot:1732242-Rhodomonas_salina.2
MPSLVPRHPRDSTLSCAPCPLRFRPRRTWPSRSVPRGRDHLDLGRGCWRGFDRWKVSLRLLGPGALRLRLGLAARWRHRAALSPSGPTVAAHSHAEHDCKASSRPAHCHLKRHVRRRLAIVLCARVWLLLGRGCRLWLGSIPAIAWHTWRCSIACVS